MDQSIQARRQDLVLISKKITFQLVDFAVPVYHRVKIKVRENLFKIDKKKAVEDKGDGDINHNWCPWKSP